MNEECDLCAKSVLSIWRFDPHQRDCYYQQNHGLFHTPCSVCDTQEPSPDLCSYCQHLRLRHLIGCVRSEGIKSIRFSLHDRVTAQTKASACPLCSFFSHSIGEKQFGGLDWRSGSVLSQVNLTFGGHQRGLLSLIENSFIMKRADRSQFYGSEELARLNIEEVTSRVTKPVIGDYCDWNMIRLRFNDCKANHDQCTIQNKARLPDSFRVIDVSSHCIVETSETEFVALSYVWGRDPGHSLATLTSLSLAGMLVPGSLTKEKLPRTIQDAMIVCRRLGERYLWVDRLCIQQDDPIEKPNTIGAMSEIFSMAELVIIAAHGSHMNFGIRGVSSPRTPHRHQLSQEVDGVLLTNYVEENDHLDPEVVWDSRGWTYQEDILARRRLRLDGNSSLYECRHSICREDNFNHDTRGEKIRARTVHATDLKLSQYDMYKRHIRQYTSRQLTHRSDVYNAVSGIMKALYGSEANFEFGLPHAHFNQALLWICKSTPNSEESMSHSRIVDHTDAIVSPSWSWSYAMDQSQGVDYLFEPSGSCHIPLAMWEVPKVVDGKIRLERIQPTQEPGKDEDWMVTMALACHHGCFEKVAFDIDFQQETWSSIGRRFGDFWPHQPNLDFMNASCDAAHEDQHTAQADSRRSVILSSPGGLLYTRWQRTYLHLQLDEEYIDYFDIIDPTHKNKIGKLCGSILVSSRPYLMPAAKGGSAHSTTLFEFGAISIGCYPEVSANSAKTRKRFVDASGDWSPGVSKVNVLLVRNEQGISHRLAFGYIYLKHWVQLGREWTDVLLG